MVRSAHFLCAVVVAASVASCNEPAQTEQPQDNPDAMRLPAMIQWGYNTSDFNPDSQMPIQSVDAVMLIPHSTQTMEGLSVRASGTVFSPGWTQPELQPVTSNDDSVRSFRFVAKSPPRRDVHGAAYPVEAEFDFPTVPKSVKEIRVISATNTVAARLSP